MLLAVCMRLQISRTKNAASFYVVESTYLNGKHSSRVVERLGSEAELREKQGVDDVTAWAKAYVDDLNVQDKKRKREVVARYSPVKQIPLNSARLFDGGHLFLEGICTGLGFNGACHELAAHRKFEFDLGAILRMMVQTRILSPSSKRSSFETAKGFIESPSYALEDVYRSLDVLATGSDMLQAHVCKSSKKLVARNTDVLYYDCTNYYFEVEKEDGLRQWGHSKEHRPNPIVQMGLFMDGGGIPLGFSLFNGAGGEQPSLKPLEERIVKDFALRKFIVCAHAGLGSMSNRVFNDAKDRAYVVTQSLKMADESMSEWALSTAGWRLSGSDALINLHDIDDSSNNSSVYFKNKPLRRETRDESGNKVYLDETWIVTYSPKRKAYQREIRSLQINRAMKMIGKPSKRHKRNPHDPARFLNVTHATSDGEVASREAVALNQGAIDKEAMYDGFYCVATNLQDDTERVLGINQGRWEIEESFRILKTEFEARPVYVSRQSRIKAHFLICFLALLVMRVLEQKLEGDFTIPEILKTLRSIKYLKLGDDGYIPAYTRTPLTDALQAAVGFSADTEIVTQKQMKYIKKVITMA
jgi:transposase